MAESSTRRCRCCGRTKECPRLICATGWPTCRACARRNRALCKRRYRKPRRACSDCGGPKQPGVGRRWCDACLERRRARPVRRCRCGAVIAKRCRTCRACQRERKRKANRQWIASHREQASAAQRRYAERHPDRQAAATRRWYQAVKADPKRWAALLETHRMNARLRAERAGRPMRPVPEHVYERRAGAIHRGRLDPAPVRALVQDWVASGETLGELARAAGVSERLLYRLLNEDPARISLVAADRIVVALGLHLDLVA